MDASRILSAAGKVEIRLSRWRRSTIILVALGFLGLFVLGCFTAVHWPYRYREIHPLLIDVFGSQIKIAHYRRVYLPRPGFIATGITITRSSASQQIIFGTVQTLYVQGEWLDLLLLRRRVRLVEMTSVHLIVPTAGSRASQEEFPAGSAGSFSGPSTAVEVLRMHNSVLEVQHDGGKSLRFAIRELQLTNVQRGKPIGYVVDMENPFPAGHISASGSFGPLNAKQVGATRVSGQFSFNKVKLSDVGDLRGTLASSGQFSGSLRAIAASAVSETPDFAVDDGKPTPVQGSVQCVVNGLTGDVFFQSIEVKSGRTVIRAHGQVAGSSKITNVDISVDGGRAEELLRPFIHEDVPVTGGASLRAHAWVGPAGQPFLERLRVSGRFDLPSDEATNPQIESSLSAFSAREQEGVSKPNAEPPSGHSSNSSPDQPAVLSSLTGPVTIRNGVMASPALLFRLPGAHVRLHGDFNLNNGSVHLVGELQMESGISHATTGWKSALLKPLSLLFKRKHRSGSRIPIVVTGTPGHYNVTQDISRTK